MVTLTHREAKYVSQRLLGKSKKQALLDAGFSKWIAQCPAQIETPEIAATIEKLTQELVEHTLREGLTDAIEIHQTLSEQFRGDLAELYTEEGELKPVKEWPLWARQGGVEVLDEPNMVHSADGGSDSWDQVGRRIKVKSGSRAKVAELLMKHKAVNAMVEQKQGDINVVVVTAERAREVSAAKKRLAKVVEVEPENAT